MLSMWTDGISDRDYLDQFAVGDYEDQEPEERCFDCGAKVNLQPCEEDCPSRCSDPDRGLLVEKREEAA